MHSQHVTQLGAHHTYRDCYASSCQCVLQQMAHQTATGCAYHQAGYENTRWGRHAISEVELQNKRRTQVGSTERHNTCVVEDSSHKQCRLLRRTRSI